MALIGSNGAGKTTLLNVVSGVLHPTEGQIIFGGRKINHTNPSEMVRLGLIQVPEGRQLFGPLTVMENLELGAYARFTLRSRREIYAEIDRIFAMFPILAQRRRQLAGTLSGGEQQMLAIGRGLMGNPKMLLLDEPSMGLAPMAAMEIFQTIQSLRNRGATILLVEQNARAALSISDRAYVLETGSVTLSGQAADLMDNHEVKRAFLGKDYRHVKER
ncbi:MAG: ABC transporter ATP-binding protein [Deltaproteobacteria bacterium]|nr:ABC transporter ATP-binding protein [Deltaproteobacteria bacterium]